MARHLQLHMEAGRPELFMELSMKQTNWHRFVSILVLIFTALGIFLPITNVKAGAAYPVNISPGTTNAEVGDTGSVSATVHNAINAWGMDVSISFDPTIISATIDNGGFLSFGQLVEGPSASDFDGSDGSLRYVMVQTSGQTPKNGTGSLVEIQFTALQPGTTPVTITNCEVSEYIITNNSYDSHGCTITNGTIVVNTPPSAGNDSYSVDEDATLTVAAGSGVLSNDSDSDGGPSALTASYVDGPSHGSLSLNANGGFTYTPTANYSGADSFRYSAYDGLGYSGNATVSLTINPVADAPVATSNTYSGSEDTLMTIPAPGVLANDSDPDGDILNPVLVEDVAHGTLSLNSNGGFTYQPQSNYNGTDNFTYYATDGVLNSNTVAVTLDISAVNDLPTANTDSYNTNEDTPLNVPAPGVLSNDSDLDGPNSLTASKVSDPAHGYLSFNSDGSFSYTPAINYYGSDSFTYRVSDGVEQSNIATVSINVASVNDAPTANSNAYTLNQGTILSVLMPGVLGNDSDPEGSVLTAVLSSNVSHGTLTLNSNGSFTYKPVSSFAGSDSFKYRAFDGGLYSFVTTVNLTVIPISQPTFTPTKTPGTGPITTKTATPTLTVTPTITTTATPGPVQTGTVTGTAIVATAKVVENTATELAQTPQVDLTATALASVNTIQTTLEQGGEVGPSGETGATTNWAPFGIDLGKWGTWPPSALQMGWCLLCLILFLLVLLLVFLVFRRRRKSDDK